MQSKQTIDNKDFKDINAKLIENKMVILFIVTIVSFFAAVYLISYLYNLNNQHFNFYKSMWIFWCFLPIPVISIVLGYKYQKSGINCKRNIISGYIVGFLLLAYGSFYFFPDYSKNYEEIYTYKEIINLELPSNGQLEIRNWVNYFDDDKTDYVTIKAYYAKEDVSKLVNSIKNSDKWILSKEIESKIKIFIPSTFRSDDDVYYSIYNMTTNEYNSLPKDSGIYSIYSMKYDISEKLLEIHNFKYVYK